jgi:hypothetical protein
MRNITRTHRATMRNKFSAYHANTSMKNKIRTYFITSVKYLMNIS